jgi:hypothetical protein
LKSAVTLPSYERDARPGENAICAKAFPANFASALLLAICTFFPFATGAAAAYSNSHPDAAASVAASDAYGKLPLSFEANQGQSDKQVKFLSRGPGYALFLTPTEAVLSLQAGPGQRGKKASLLPVSTRPKDAPSKAAVLRVRLEHANRNPKVSGLEELPGKTNYFIGNDPARWRREIPRFGKVKYRQVYSGVDLLYYGNQRQLEYDFVIAPGADPTQIELSFDGAERLRVDADGNLLVSIPEGEIVEHTPVIYQDLDGMRRRVAGGYELKSRHTVAFKLAAYDSRKRLTIDPSLAYSTYLHGSTGDNGNAIAVDSSGNAYVTGITNSSDFPTTPGALQPTSGGGAFVSKLNKRGTALVYSTYLGGSGGGGADGEGIAVDSSGNAYVTGSTHSSDFPTTAGALQSTSGGGFDAFVSKLNSTGTALVYSTYLGGSIDDYGFGIAVDSSGNAYVTGYTDSINFPTTAGALQTTYGGGYADVFISKLNSVGTALVYSTYLGGKGGDVGDGIAVDSSGHAYVTGYTVSINFPSTPGAFETITGGLTTFVSKLNSGGTALVYSTGLGGDSSGSGIAVDSSGNTFVTGDTSWPYFPTTPGAFQTTLAGTDNAFVSKLNAGGSALLYSTYLGGNQIDSGQGIAVDSSGNAYVIGYTTSSNFPTTADAFQTTLGLCQKAFVSKLNSGGTSLLYSTYLGGSGGEFGLGIAVDPPGNAYVTGYTQSTDFPTTAGAFQTAFGKGSNSKVDAYVSKLNIGMQFARFTGKLDVTVSTGSFDLDSSFRLGAGTSGFNPVAENLTLQMGTYSLTLPAKKGAPFLFAGTIDGVAVHLRIMRVIGNRYML